MAKQLRGTRYLTAENGWLAEFITTQLAYLDLDETAAWYGEIHRRGLDVKSRALLACNDRFYLLTGLLGREDLLHPWLFARCREVEAEPDGCIDLWARSHGKSSVITTGGTLQEIFCDPEITIAIFSVTRPLAAEFLAQIKNEMETNEHLKEVFCDVLYANPRTRGADGRPAKWSLARGITVKRKGHPKEATVEAHGLIDGQPTGRHFKMHVYDDIVTQDYLEESALKKTIERFEMADNLGTRYGVRKQVAGTRYHFADAYGHMLEKGSGKPRIYPATIDGTLNGELVLLTPGNWDRIKRDQGHKTVSAQMLLNPLAGTEATFLSLWLRGYEVLPATMNVYVLVDPSKGKGSRSDRTAIAVIGVDQGSNKYLIDGYCHRMKLSERWENIKAMKRKWEAHPGVQMVRVGYEQYGMLDDISVLEDMMQSEKNSFEIVELKTPETGGHSKEDRIDRLEPDLRNGRFHLPVVAYNPEAGQPEHGFHCFWSVWTQEHVAAAKAKGIAPSDYHVGQIIYRPMQGFTTRMIEMDRTSQKFRIVTALKRRDENNDIYDLTRMFIDEAIRHPFAAHDDLIDAAARIYDMDPQAPVQYERQSTEPLGIEAEDLGA